MLACISSVKDMEISVDLPFQLAGRIPITEISDEVTAAVERVAEGSDSDSDDEDEDMDSDSDESSPKLPQLREMFRVGQFVRCRITGVKMEDVQGKLRAIIELSMRPASVNQDVPKVDLTEGVVSSSSSSSNSGVIGMDGI